MRKFSFRPFPLAGKILYKLTELRHGKYVLVAKPDGSHYEEHIPRDNAQMRYEAEERAFSGTLGGHVVANLCLEKDGLLA